MYLSQENYKIFFFGLGWSQLC